MQKNSSTFEKSPEHARVFRNLTILSDITARKELREEMLRNLNDDDIHAHVTYVRGLLGKDYSIEPLTRLEALSTTRGLYSSLEGVASYLRRHAKSLLKSNY